MNSNRTLRCVSYPLHDVMVAAKAGTEKVDSLWRQIQESLQRNMLPSASVGAAPAVRSQPGVALNSTHQLLDRLVLQVNEAVRNVQRQGGGDAKAGDVEMARNLLDDANGAKQVRRSKLLRLIIFIYLIKN